MQSPKKAQLWHDMMEQPWILLPDFDNWPMASKIALLDHIAKNLIKNGLDVIYYVQKAEDESVMEDQP